MNLLAFAAVTLLFLSQPRNVNCDTSCAVIVDAGSTGSRCYIVQDKISSGARYVSVTPGIKVKPGLSTFTGEDHQALLEYMKPLLEAVKDIKPVECNGRLALHIRGTGGMRLLSLEQQNVIWDNLYELLVSHYNDLFLLVRDNIGTISGSLEAFYAVLSSNYIAHRIDGWIRPINGSRMLGALDMGGSSTQLIFHTGTAIGEPVRVEHFWSHSWLSFGAEQVQERLWNYFIQSISEGSSVLDEKNLESTSTAATTCASNERLPAVYFNPCAFSGRREAVSRINGTVLADSGVLNVQDFVIFEGTGDSDKCAILVEELLWPSLEGGKESCRVHGQACPIGGVLPPPMNDLHFFGMSAYYYALDCVRELGPDHIVHWPTPTIDELQDSIKQFCSMHWGGDGSHLMGRHKFTSDEKLPYRCLESVYIVTLLEFGFGFHGSHRNITLANEVEGTEVEWTLGYALAELSNIQSYTAEYTPQVKSMTAALKNLFCNGNTYFEYICDLMLPSDEGLV